MGKINEYTGLEKLEILQEYEDGKGTLKGIAKKYNIHKNTFKLWRRKYKLFGMAGLEIQQHHQHYSAELKRHSVEDYLSGQFSQYEILEKYKLRSRSQLQRWIAKYNCHSTLKSSHGGQIAMTKGRTTTYQERIDIVNFCIAYQRDYRKTMEKFQVSYQQVYQWVQKFQKGGVDALQDRRGQKKRIEELNDADAQKLAMKKLEYENERLRVENMFLKKLREFQRRGK